MSSTPQAPATVRRATAPLQYALQIIAGFMPWIVYWILVGNVPFRVAVVVALALSLAVSGLGLVRGRRPKTLELGGNAVFIVLTVLTFSVDDAFLERWIQPLTNAGLLAVTLGSILARRPFTLDYAREAVTPEVAAMPGFVVINYVVTWIWVAAFALMTVSALIPPIVQGNATLLDGSTPLSIVCYWIVPFAGLALAVLFSQRFPDWFAGRLHEQDEARSARDEVAVAPAPASVALAPRPARLEHGSVRLSITSLSALHDTPWQLAVTGAPPGAPVSLAATTSDLTGRSWRAWAEFRAGEGGAVDVATDAPVRGTYQGVDPMGLLWSMEGAGTPDLFIPPPTPLPITIEARSGDAQLHATVTRIPAGEGVQVTDLREPDVVGRLFLPPGDGPFAGVAVFGGSEGGLDAQSLTGALLASHGYAALVVAYFGVEGLPEHLVEIPLERFAGGIRRLRSEAAVDGGRVAALAVSKGAEGLLAAASVIPDLRETPLVLVSPSSQVWQAIGDEGPIPDRSSWTLEGKPLAFRPLNGEALMPELLRNALLGARLRRRQLPTLLRLAPAYASHEGGAPGDGQGAIAAEQVTAPLLCLSGADDSVWPSAAMVEELCARRGDRGAGDERHTYPGAGHLLRPPQLPATALWSSGIAFGGAPATHAAAEADAWGRVLGFLARTVGGGS